jgi:hypothetical protein
VERVVERARDVGYVRLGERAAVRVHGEREAVLALVLLGVGQRRCAEERQAERAVLTRVAVLAVVDERDAVAELGQVGVAVAADFELCALPGRVAVRRALAQAELVLEGSASESPSVAQPWDGRKARERTRRRQSA